MKSTIATLTLLVSATSSNAETIQSWMDKALSGNEEKAQQAVYYAEAVIDAARTATNCYIDGIDPLDVALKTITMVESNYDSLGFRRTFPASLPMMIVIKPMLKCKHLTEKKADV